jgi:hypothetical protein
MLWAVCCVCFIGFFRLGEPLYSPRWRPECSSQVSCLDGGMARPFTKPWVIQKLREALTAIVLDPAGHVASRSAQRQQQRQRALKIRPYRRWGGGQAQPSYHIFD